MVNSYEDLLMIVFTIYYFLFTIYSVSKCKK